LTRKARWSERWVVEPDPSHDPWTCAMRHEDSVIVEWSMIITFHDATILPPTYLIHSQSTQTTPNHQTAVVATIPNKSQLHYVEPRLAKILTTTTPTRTHMQMHSCPSRPPFCEPKMSCIPPIPHLPITRPRLLQRHSPLPSIRPLHLHTSLHTATDVPS